MTESLWVYLAASPLLWLTATMVAFVIADTISKRCHRHPLAHPVVLATALLVPILLVTGTSYETYFNGAQFVHFLLGPAIVALAIPLYENRLVVGKALLPIGAALLVGSVVASSSAVVLGWMMGAPFKILVALAPKSVTAGIAMGIARELGGEPSLAATFVLATGIFGGMILLPLMKALNMDDRATGFAAGLASHGLGTAVAFQLTPLAGTFAGIAMGLNGLMTALIVPVLIRFFS